LSGQGAALSAEVEASEAAEAARDSLGAGAEMVTELSQEDLDAQDAAPGGSEVDAKAQALERDDVAFDAAAAELSALEDDAEIDGARGEDQGAAGS